MVTGPLGGSIRGKHLDFTPRVREALALHTAADLHAMIDISDGLAADVDHLCVESGCGAVFDAAAIPISEAARAMNDDRSPLEHALGDGEDFELVFSVDPRQGKLLMETQPVPGVTLVRIGQCVEKGLWLEQKGQHTPLPPQGYVHKFE
jgi:thiamine-monophosphate kinase